MTRLVIHADDVGMCHGANAAFLELSQLGTITSGSVMVPCPWFPELAAMASERPGLDVGVHLTLTSEHRYYRWGPVSRPSATAGLLDDDGFLWRDVAGVRAHAHPEAVEAEWRAQIDRALAFGIDVTHLDAHMGAALAPEWCERYVRVGVEYRLPVLITATLAGYAPNNHIAGTDEARFAPFVDQARTAGLPVFDRVIETDFGRPADVAADYVAVFDGIVEPLVFGAFHPCAPGPGEVEMIEPHASHVRTDEYQLFRTGEWQTSLSARPLELTGFREIRDAWRAAPPV